MSAEQHEYAKSDTTDWRYCPYCGVPVFVLEVVDNTAGAILEYIVESDEEGGRGNFAELGLYETHFCGAS